MKPAPFTYHDPTTADEAVALLASHEDAKILAGGQSLMPMLNMRFVVYNPLAGGLLTGKHAGKLARPGDSETGKGRFTGNQMYIDRFWNEAYFDAVDAVAAACAESGETGLTPASAALRWLYSHSQLDGAKGDAVILGASSVAHLDANLAAARVAAAGEPLPAVVLEAIENANRACAPAAPPYFRGHSKLK